MVHPRMAPTSSKYTAALVALLVVGSALQASLPLLHHASLEDTAAEIRKEEASISPHVRWESTTTTQTTVGTSSTQQGVGVSTGIDIVPLMKFVNDSAGITGPSYEPKHPDDLYVIRTAEEGHPTFVLSMNTYWKHPVAFRRRELTDGLNFVQSSLQERLAMNMTAWPRIATAISNGKDFPLLISWDSSENCTNTCCDYTMDPSGTLPMDDAVPVLRYVAPPDCRHRLFSPTGRILQLALGRTSSSTTTTTNAAGTSWTDKFQTNEQQHPYHQKVKRIVYRGRMAIHPHPTIMDIMDYAETEPSYDWDNFQKYIAVLDIDTLHYPQLLCQNSVILKTTPKCMDMFVGSILPWIHYIPVEPDLSDLEERFKFIVEHEDKVKIMIQNANDWCASHLQYTVLQDHFLTTVTQYLEQLDRHDNHWQQIWMDQKDTYLSGHFMLYRQHAYSLPKPVVGAIKQGLRRDSPSYNATSGNVERTLIESITSKWGKEKQAAYMMKLKEGKQ